MTDIDRLAALLRDNALLATVGVTNNDEYWPVLAARLIAQGVRVGDPPRPADDAGGLRAAAEDVVLQEGTYRRRLSGTGRVDVVADPALAVVPKAALDRLRAALAAPPPADDAGGLRAIEHAARDVDGLWHAEDGEVIRWDPEAAEALEDLRAALAAQPAPPALGTGGSSSPDALGLANLAQPAPPALTAASPEAAGLDRERLQAILDAADAMAEAWAKGGWRISTDYHTIEVAYERYLMARTK